MPQLQEQLQEQLQGEAGLLIYSKLGLVLTCCRLSCSIQYSSGEVEELDLEVSWIAHLVQCSP